MEVYIYAMLRKWNYTRTVLVWVKRPVAMVERQRIWWMRKSKSPEFPQLKDNAYHVRAQVDVLMPGDMGHTARKYQSDGTLLKTIDQPEGITRGELQRTARNVLNFIVRLKSKT